MRNDNQKDTDRDRLVRSILEDIMYLEEKIARVSKGGDRTIDAKPQLLADALGHLGNARVMIAQGMVEPEGVLHGTLA